METQHQRRDQNKNLLTRLDRNFLTAHLGGLEPELLPGGEVTIAGIICLHFREENPIPELSMLQFQGLLVNMFSTEHKDLTTRELLDDSQSNGAILTSPTDDASAPAGLQTTSTASEKLATVMTPSVSFSPSLISGCAGQNETVGKGQNRRDMDQTKDT